MKLNYTGPLIDKDKLENIKQSIQKTHELLDEKLDFGNDLLGWMNLPYNYDKNEFQRVKETARRVQKNSDILIVIGIGGSYLGSRACIEALSHSFYNLRAKANKGLPEIYYVGDNVSSNYIMDLIDIIKDKDISINIISKSGATVRRQYLFVYLKKY